MRYLPLCLLACCLAAADMEVKDTPWCTITVPKTAKHGEQVEAKIAIKAGAISEDSTLHIDLHKYVGKDRKPGAGHAKPIKVTAGAAVETTYSPTVPEDASAVSFVVYLLPAGKNNWSDHTNVTELGVKIDG